MRVMASDLAAIRAEGRRLLADFHAFGTEDDGFRRDKLIDFWYDHADALLADPAPSVPLVEAGAALPKWLGRSSPEGLVTLHGERFTVEATGESETLNLGSHGEQIGHWYPVKSPLYRLVPYQPEDTKGAGYE